jgi:hypothetical protein
VQIQDFSLIANVEASLAGSEEQPLADSVENSRPWFEHQKSTRPRLTSSLLAKASGLGFHVAACKKGVFTSQ